LIACGGGEYDAFLASSLIDESQLGEGWTVAEALRDDNSGGENTGGCAAKASTVANYRSPDGQRFDLVVYAFSDRHDCLDAYVSAAVGPADATIDHLSGFGCETQIIRFGPDESDMLGTSVFVAANQSMAYLNFSAAYAGDESFFHSVAETSCERLKAAEAKHF